MAKYALIKSKYIKANIILTRLFEKSQKASFQRGIAAHFAVGSNFPSGFSVFQKGKRK